MSERAELAELIADALSNPQHGEKALDSLRVADRMFAAGYRKSAEPDAVRWGVRLYPADIAIANGSWELGEILDYGTDKESARKVTKGIRTRRLVKKLSIDSEWVDA